MRIAIVSLGCPKNQVDADVFCRALLEAGHTTTEDPGEADAIVVNTCGFIQAAKEEAIEAIFDACAFKRNNEKMIVVATGCLPERYREEMAREIPELDAVVGIGANGQLPFILEALAKEKQGRTDVNSDVLPAAASGALPAAEGDGRLPREFYGPKADLNISAPRIISTPNHYAWLKVAEGCSNRCSYCTIPQIRGPQRSRSTAECVAEAEWLARQGVRELVLVAQDTTAFGRDRRGAQTLAGLLDELNAIDGLAWIRILYAYPERIDGPLLEAMARNQKVVHYLDLPVQHIDADILRSMRRKGGPKAIWQALDLIRTEMPDMTLRTSLIAGYPGETEAQFEALCAFVKEAEFDRLGCFAYSPEEGTAAARMPEQLPESERQRRAETIMRIQGEIMEKKQKAQLGQTLRALCDGPCEGQAHTWLVRTAQDAPEIDTEIFVRSKKALRAGCFYDIKIGKWDAGVLEAAADGAKAM